jgi:glycosyltransferase involved in cell wall biosynthesis
MQVERYPLAILSPAIGLPSETFIRRHIEDVLPGGTVVVTHELNNHSGQQYWTIGCPAWELRAYQTASFSVRIVRRVLRRCGGDPQRSAIKTFLRKHGVTTVLGEYLDFSLPFLDLAKDLGLRFFGHAHGYDVSTKLRDPYWQGEYIKYNNADGVIAVSQASRKRLVALGLDASKVFVIPCGVVVPCAPPTHVPRSDVRCIAVGRMVAKKGPILTLDAFRRATAMYHQLRLDYVGDGPLFSAARQFVRAFNLEDRVTFHGAQPHDAVQALMDNAGIFIQHSLTDPDTGDEEGLPVSVLEAMANALPVVSTFHAGIPEAVESGITGYLGAEGDTEATAGYIVELARNTELRTQMGEAGWLRARDLFSIERERKDLLDVLGLEKENATPWACWGI